MNNPNRPTKSLAWLIALILLAIFGIAIFQSGYLFGRIG